jgi:hypothetical protein
VDTTPLPVWVDGASLISSSCVEGKADMPNEELHAGTLDADDSQSDHEPGWTEIES